MGQSSKQTYVKHHVKRNPQNLKFLEKEGNPVPGDEIRTVRITEGQAEELNSGWANSGHVYVLAKGQPKDEELDQLWAEVNALVEQGKLEAPHPATGAKRLRALIEKAK